MGQVSCSQSNQPQNQGIGSWKKNLPCKEDIVVVVWLGEALLYTLKIQLQPEVEEKFSKFRVKKNIRKPLFDA